MEVIGLVTFLQKIIRFYIFLIIIRSLLTWISVGYHPALGILYRITDPFLNFIRRYLITIGGLDFSAMIAIFILFLAEKMLLFLVYTILL